MRLSDKEIERRVREIRESKINTDQQMDDSNIVFGLDDFVDYRAVTQYDIECFTKKMIAILENGNGDRYQRANDQKKSKPD
jgi:hypothetical protein